MKIAAESEQGTNSIPMIKSGGKTVLGKVNKEKIMDYPNTMYSYQRFMNNLIGAIGVIKGPGMTYPYLDWDPSGNIYINDTEQALTGIDIKTVDIANVRQKTQEFIDKLKDPDTRLKLETIAVHVEKIILKYFYDKQKHEVKEKKRYGKETETGRIIYPRFFDTQEEKKGKHIMEALYNMMGAVRMEYFDYNKEENKATLNQKGKDWLLNELYKEIDDINKYKFTNIDDIFPGSDYPQIKSKNIKAEDIDTMDVISITQYLLAAHHSIDDMTELYSQMAQNNNTLEINKPIRRLLKGLIKTAINKCSTSTKISDIIDTRKPKEIASKLKTARGSLLQRIAIAAPYLQRKYDFSTIEKTYKSIIEPLKDELKNEFPGIIKHVNLRRKTEFSAKNKILRAKSISDIRDMIGCQIFVDNSQIDNGNNIEEIFAYINHYINTGRIDTENKVNITHIDIDNRQLVIEESRGNAMIEKFANENTYTVQERKDKKTKEKQPAHNNQDIIINFFSQGNTGGNGGRKTVKEITKYEVESEELTIDKTSGIEVQMLPYGVSINANEANHPFLETQKTIDLVINTNTICPRENYCKIKDVAIAEVAYKTKEIRNKLKNGIQGEYTQEMFDKEKYYTIAIDNKNKAFIDRTQGQRDPEIIRIDNDVVKINLIVLEELSSSVSKRRAADLIIMDQVNKELQSGKLIQYHYYNDINDESDPLIDIREDIELPIIRKPYPRVTDIIRDETGELLYNSRNFINPGSKTRINTAQTPRNAYIFIPDDDGENGYAQSIPNLSYALKVKDVTENTTTTDLAETLQQN